MKSFLTYIDILGFEEKAKKEAQKSNLEPEEIRDAYRKRIKRRLKMSKIIRLSQEVSLDSWLLFTNSIWKAFDSVEEILKTKLDLEVGIEVKEFDESPAGEELIVLRDEAISYIKTILDSYKCYKNGKSIKQTFILLTEDAYKELDYKKMCYDKIYESTKGSKFYLIKKDEFERRSSIPRQKIMDTVIKNKVEIIHYKIEKGIGWLYSNKSKDGHGWGITKDRPSRILNTCEAIIGIISSADITLKKDRLLKGYLQPLDWICKSKCSDGGFPSLSFNELMGYCRSTTECTAWGIYTLTSLREYMKNLSFKRDYERIIKDGCRWLQQNYDRKYGGWGSWYGEPIRFYPTIWALKALNKARNLQASQLNWCKEEYIKKFLELASDKGCFGFYPYSKPKASITALSLILFKELENSKIYHEGFEDFIGLGKNFLLKVRNNETKLWDSEEKIRTFSEILTKDGEHLTFPFTHLSSAWAIQGLCSIQDQLTTEEHYQLIESIDAFSNLAHRKDGFFRWTTGSGIIPTFATSLSLITLSGSFRYLMISTNNHIFKR